MDGPQSSLKTENMHSLYFQDLVVLRQFLEKGFRQNFFQNNEEKAANDLHKKINNIICDIMAEKKDK